MDVPTPSLNADFPKGDARDDFARYTAANPLSAGAESSFIASKLHLLRTHPMVPSKRLTAISQFTAGLRSFAPAIPTHPIPGGVGFGIFYDSTFKTSFATGTSISWQIVCPTPPGGNVTDWLYVTATNRSSMGVEAFVAYHGQNDTSFSIFDWARPDGQRWQTHVAFANLANYLTSSSVDGNALQVLAVINSTYETSADSWRNEASLFNHATSQWDLIYQFDYPATIAQQTAGWVGSWGPIVETFQDSYQGTNNMGAIQAQVMTRDAAGQWGGEWHPLGTADASLRVDNKGFQETFLDPNSSWAVHS